MEWFEKLHAFIEAAEKKADELTEKGADFLESAAVYLRNLFGGAVMSTGPEFDTDLATCENRLRALTAVGAEPDPKKIDPATIALFIQLALAIIELIKKRREPKT